MIPPLHVHRPIYSMHQTKEGIAAAQIIRSQKIEGRFALFADIRFFVHQAHRHRIKLKIGFNNGIETLRRQALVKI